MKNPSCATQNESLLKLFGVVGAEHFQARAYSPCTGSFSALHAKTWCADGLVYLGGSLNFTRNAAMNNEEHIVVLKDPGAVKTHQGWFEDLWAKADIHTTETVAELSPKIKTAKEAKRGPSRSPSIQRDASYTSVGSVPEDALALAPDTASIAAAVALTVSSSPLGSPGRVAQPSLVETLATRHLWL